MEEEKHRLVEMIAVIDIDPSLTLYRPIEEKWVSSVELLTESPKDTRSKILQLAPHLYLLVNYNEKNKLPIYELEFMAKPPVDWHTIKIPPPFAEKYGQLSLCYRTEPLEETEPLTDIDILNKKINEEREVFMVPTGFKILSTNPIPSSYIILKKMKSILEKTFKPLLFEIFPTNNLYLNTSLLPMFCFPEGIRLSRELRGFINYNFINTLETGERIYITCLSFRESLPEMYRTKLQFQINEEIYYEKALCILSKYRFTDEFVEILKHFYRLSISKNEVPFYKIIQKFQKEMICPLDNNGISYSYGGCETIFEINPAYSAVSECSMYCIFKFLPLTAILNIFEAILIEKKVIFVSQSKTVLGYAVEAFLTLIYPFQWEHVLIPILPLTEREYLNAPVPLIAGIHPSLIDANIEPDILIVQLDTAEILNDEDLPPLPEKMEKLLRKRLQPFEIYDDIAVKEFLENPESTYIFKMQAVDHPHFHSNTIRDIFFEFMLILMKNYKKFWIDKKITQSSINEVFKIQEFLSDLGMSKVGSFGYRLTEGLLFTSFLERRYAHSLEPVFIFFDDCLEKKKKNKEIFFFLKHQNKKYTVFIHPESENIKELYSYEKFPSILNEIMEDSIQLSIIEGEDLFIEEIKCYIEQEYQSSKEFYSKTNEFKDLEGKVFSLLLKVYRDEYLKRKKLLLAHSLDLRNLNKNKIEINDYISFFEEFYVMQLKKIEELKEELAVWKDEEEKSNFIRINKIHYFIKILNRGISENDENKLIGVYESCNNQYINYKFLIKGNTQLIICDSETKEENSAENGRNSLKNIKLKIYIPDFNLRFIFNSLINRNPFAMFNFILAQIQNRRDERWSVEELFLLKETLKNKKNNKND